MEWHRRCSYWPGQLPAAGGLEDQDALLLEALIVLRQESDHIDAALMRDRDSHGK